MNNAQRNGDKSKISTLGAFSFVLNLILGYAPRKRTDIDIKPFEEGCVLYRGGGITQSLFKTFKDLQGQTYENDIISGD